MRDLYHCYMSTSLCAKQHHFMMCVLPCFLQVVANSVQSPGEVYLMTKFS
jgi:hypothetical protein